MSRNKKQYNKRPSLSWLDKMGWNQPSNYGIGRKIAAEASGTLLNEEGWYHEYKEKCKIALIKLEKRYWNNFFVFYDKDTLEPFHSLDKVAKPYIIDAMWENSGVALKYNQQLDEWYVYRITMFWLNPSYQIERCNGLIYSYPMAFTNSQGYFDQMTKENMSFVDTPATLSNTDAIPWAEGIDMWAERYWQRWNALDINIANSMNIKGISSENVSANKIAEIEYEHSGKSPLTIIQGDFEGLVDLGLENRQRDIWEDMDSFWKEFFRVRGMRYNFDAKAERNVSAEVGNNNALFLTCEKQRLNRLEYLMDRVNEIYGLNIGVTNIMELEDKRRKMMEAVPDIIKATEIEEQTNPDVVEEREVV